MPRKITDPEPPVFSGWIPAAYDGECVECGAEITAGLDEIRRVGSGWQGRECCGEDDDDATQG